MDSNYDPSRYEKSKKMNKAEFILKVPKKIGLTKADRAIIRDKKNTRWVLSIAKKNSEKYDHAIIPSLYPKNLDV
ncbi:hypothetical protein QUF70_21005 [Desulfobacterales bacterium HSG17]|nr:hypothetical protein [Desulfobacterales bacterium HSG17]